MKRQMKKRTKIILTILGVALVLVIGVYTYIGNTLYELALNPHADRSKVFSADHNSMNRDVAVVARPGDIIYKEATEWYADIEIGDRTMESRDDLTLHAYSIMQEENQHLWAVLCHGYSGNGTQNSTSAYQFYQRGYNLIMPDARGHGFSEGDYIGMGWDDRLDIVDWINQIVEEDPDAEIVLFGVSMGAATVMMVSGEDLPVNVKAIVEDCGYTSVWGEFGYQLKMLFNIPEFPALNFASLITKLRAGWWLDDGSAIDQVAKSKTPIFFIHGDSDTFVPFFMLQEVYDAATVEKDILVVEGAGHGQAASYLGQEYWDRVFAFVDQYVQ